MERLSREVDEMKRTIEELRSPLVFSHNDTLSRNMIYDETAGMVVTISVPTNY